MKLRVRNFGPIRKADVDIKPLTVFAGPSNTGKSYLAILLYSIAKTLEDEEGRIFFSGHRHFDELLRKRLLGKVPAQTIAADKKLAHDVKQSLSLYGDAISQTWHDEAARCFGEEWGQIVKKNGAAGCDIAIEKESGSVALNLTQSGKNKLPPVSSLLKTVQKRINAITDKGGMAPMSRVVAIDRAAGRFAGEIADIFKFLPSQRPFRYRQSSGNTGEYVHYLPAVRGGIMQSYRTLVSALIKGATRIGITGAAIIPFTGVLGDFLSKLINIDAASASPRHLSKTERGRLFAKLSGDIERRIIDGAIHVNKSATEYPDFRYAFSDRNKKPRDMPLMSASALVSELAPIIMFIRHYLAPGDIFIVEEPEAHLHPEAQREISEALIKLVQAGVYVVVTTHSEVILGQLSNFIHADDFPDAKVLGKKSRGRTISKDKTAMYSFDETRTGTVVREIRFDEETGMLPRKHLDISSDLLNEYARILDRRNNVKT